ncbi:MAG TPA: phosphoglucosamine mutase [Phycisphaerae bacterium]|nr:phosphoglucosamine mutase [Phycisphaerae bacterium]
MAQLIVSISGIRGIVGDGLGPQEAERFGLAFGTHLGGGTVVLGRDSRPTGPMLADAVRAGLLATGCTVLDVGILSTPGISLMVRRRQASGGVVITASHNPPAYNGIKLLSAEGMALDRAHAADVVGLWGRNEFATSDAPGLSEATDDGARIHVERVLGILDVETIRTRAFRVALDPVNGAGGREMTMLLERLGCSVTVIHGDPTGEFGRGAEPLPENLIALGSAVADAKASLGLALDPDADRLALVDETGRAVGEEYTLALATRHRLTQQRGPVAANLSTSRMMDHVAGEAGVTLHRTPVGELNVAEAILAHGCVIGGEGNGGVIDPRVVPVRDSLVGAGLVLEMMAAQNRKLSELCADLPVYTMVKDKVPLGDTDPETVLAAARRRFCGARLDERDGLHVVWDEGWLHVRASNTEPILRIMAEARDASTARGWVGEIKALAATC